MAELMLGQPLFPGESGIDQLVEIIKVLGTPSRDQIKTMNPNVSSLEAAFTRETSANGWTHLIPPTSTWSTSSPRSSLTPSPRFSDHEPRAMPSLLSRTFCNTLPRRVTREYRHDCHLDRRVPDFLGSGRIVVPCRL